MRNIFFTFRTVFYIFILSVAFISQSNFVFGQNETKAADVDPRNLTSDWWNKRFEGIKGDQLKRQISDTVSELSNYLQSLSDSNRLKASDILDKIKANLNAYESSINQPPITRPPPPVFANTYSISELIKFNQSLRKDKLDISSLKDDYREEQEQIDLTQEALDRTVEAYTHADDDTEEQIIFGFNIILYKSLLELSKSKLIHLDQKVNYLQESSANLQDQIDLATAKLKSNTEELQDYESKMQLAKGNWNRIRNRVKQKQAQILKKSVEQLDDLSIAQNELNQLDLLNLEIKERNAHINYITADMLYNLSLIILDSQEAGQNKLRKLLNQWETLLSTTERETGAWKIQTNKTLQTVSELLTIEETQNLGVANLRNIRRQSLNLAQKNLIEIRKLESEVDDAQFIHTVLKDKNASIVGGTLSFLRSIVQFSIRAWEDLESQFSKTLFRIGHQPVTFFSLIRFFFIIFVTFWIAHIVIKGLKTLTQRREGIKKAVLYRINRLIQYLILFLGLIIGLWSLGFEIGNLLIFSGALGVVLGFGMQSIFNNFISGVIILFQTQLKVGDYIELDSGLKGEIREINVRSTIITTNNGLEVLIPNSELITSKVINWTLRDPYRRVRVNFGVAYGTDVDKVAKVVIEAAKKVPITLHKIGIPEPRAFITQFGDSSIDFELVVWVNEKATRRTHRTQSAYFFALIKAFEENDIQIPFPQRDLHIKDMPETKKKK